MTNMELPHGTPPPDRIPISNPDVEPFRSGDAADDVWVLPFGVQTTVDLGRRGTVPVDATVKVSIGLAPQRGTVNASAWLEFHGRTWTIVSSDLDTTATVGDLRALLARRVPTLVDDYLKAPEHWLTWVEDRVIIGIGREPRTIGRILADAFGLPAARIATLAHQKLRYDRARITDTLRGAGRKPKEIAQILRDLGESGRQGGKRS